MTSRVWRQDLAWAAFILALAVVFGMVQHWPLVQTALKGELKPYLEQMRTQRRDVMFQGVKTVNLEQAYGLFQKGQVRFIDARQASEYEELRIPGAINLPPEKLTQEGQGALPGLDKETRLVVYCSQTSCDAALVVAEKLQSLGYAKVAVFLGGFRAWDEAGYPAETSR